MRVIKLFILDIRLYTHCNFGLNCQRDAMRIFSDFPWRVTNDITGWFHGAWREVPESAHDGPHLSSVNNQPHWFMTTIEEATEDAFKLHHSEAAPSWCLAPSLTPWSHKHFLNLLHKRDNAPRKPISHFSLVITPSFQQEQLLLQDLRMLTSKQKTQFPLFVVEPCSNHPGQSIKAAFLMTHLHLPNFNFTGCSEQSLWEPFSAVASFK